MIFKELCNHLDNKVEEIYLPGTIVPFYPIDDFKEIVPEDYHTIGWCEYNHRVEDYVIRVNIFDSKKLHL